MWSSAISIPMLSPTIELCTSLILDAGTTMHVGPNDIEVDSGRDFGPYRWERVREHDVAMGDAPSAGGLRVTVRGEDDMAGFDISRSTPLDVFVSRSTIADLPAEWSRRMEYELALMRSPLAAQLRIVEHRIQLMMRAQAVRNPRDLVATPAKHLR